MTALRHGSDPEKIIAGAKAYEKELGSKVGTEFVCMAVTWLNQRRWEDYEIQQKPLITANQEAELLERYRKRRIREGWDNGGAT